MAGESVEMIVGVVPDPQFDPVIACGAGGTAVELLKDVSGYRGRPKVEVASLRGLVLRLGAMAEYLPQVVDVDLNPIIVGPNGADMVDARIRVEQREPPSPEGARPRPTRAADHA